MKYKKVGHMENPCRKGLMQILIDPILKAYICLWPMEFTVFPDVRSTFTTEIITYETILPAI